MRINGTDIERFEAKQLRISFGQMELTNQSAWAVGSAVPYFAQNTYGFKRLTVVLMVRGDDREEIKRNCSKILALIHGRTELELDAFDTFFVGALASTPTREEKTRDRWHDLTMEFVGYEHRRPVTFTGTRTVEINNPGDLPSPAIVTLTPSQNVNPVHMTGICRDSYTGDDMPVTIKNVISGKEIVMDGTTGLITEDGDLREVDMWTLPSIAPGLSEVTCDSSYIDVSVKIYPIIM